MFALTVLSILLAVIGVSHGYSFSSLPNYDQGYMPSQPVPTYYQPRAAQNDINRPVFYPQLGMSPEYHNLVYKYITGFAGNEPVPHENVELEHHEDPKPEVEEDAEVSNNEKEGTAEESEVSPETEKPGLNDYLLPSDFILLSKKPHNHFYFDTIKIKRKNPRENPLTNPPLGGVVSDYTLLRHRPDYQNFIAFGGPQDAQLSKRQIDDTSDVDDTVVINAESQHNVKMNEEAEDAGSQQEMNENEEGDEDQPAIAQSKPAAIALAGPGGVAQASPVGTALVGPGGLAVAAPSGTAVAGPAGQGVISPGDEKAKIVHKKIKEVWNQK